MDPRGELQTHPSGRQRTRPYVESAVTFPHHHLTVHRYNDVSISHRRMNHKARWNTGSCHRAPARGGGNTVLREAKEERAWKRKEAAIR